MGAPLLNKTYVHVGLSPMPFGGSGRWGSIQATGRWFLLPVTNAFRRERSVGGDIAKSCGVDIDCHQCLSAGAVGGGARLD